MEQNHRLRLARESFAREAWADAHEQLSAADARAPLEPADLERLALTAWLLGRDAEYLGIQERAHRELVEGGDRARAARVAFWLGFALMSRGEHAQGGGWIARGRRLVAELGRECVEEGYLLLPTALAALGGGDAVAAHEMFARAAGMGEHFGDADLALLGRLGQGQSLIRSGDVGRGVTQLDEVMVSVRADDASPMVVGLVYCAVIEACQEIFDLRRAQEWTDALSGWCESQPDLVPYRGQCLVRRSEIMQLHGAWSAAAEEARRACDRLSAPPGEPAAGAAFYQRAELHRLRGELDAAEAAYREASRWGRKPQPGLALLRLASGHVDAAEAAIRRVAGEAGDRHARARVLPALVEIMLAVGDIDAARGAADELAGIAAGYGAPLLLATADQARGAVLLAAGDANAALEPLRAAWTAWEEMEAPYEAARARMLIGLACRHLGDEDTAALELDMARHAFREIGAAPDLARLEQIGRSTGHGLSARELQVLRNVAAGSTNRAIAEALFISERTVERHVSNIFRKLGVSSRSAATAYAYEHRLV